MPRKLVYLAIVVLAALHQDFWWWDDGSIVLGFLPIGLAYHAGYSVLVALLWSLALTFAWPSDVEADEDESASGVEASP